MSPTGNVTRALRSTGKALRMRPKAGVLLPVDSLIGQRIWRPFWKIIEIEMHKEHTSSVSDLRNLIRKFRVSQFKFNTSQLNMDPDINNLRDDNQSYPSFTGSAINSQDHYSSFEIGIEARKFIFFYYFYGDLIQFILIITAQTKYAVKQAIPSDMTGIHLSLPKHMCSLFS